MDDTSAHPAELDTQLAEIMAALLTLQPKGEAVTVKDPEGQISVTIGADGALSRVHVEPRWSDKIEDDALASSILTTIAEAQLEASGLGAAEDDHEPTPAEVEARSKAALDAATERLMRPISDAELQRQVDELPNLFARFDEAIEQLDAQLEKLDNPVPLEEAGADEAVAAEEGVQVRSANSMVTVTLNDGAVVDVAIHANWLPGKSGIALTECFDQIIDKLPDVAAQS